MVDNTNWKETSWVFWFCWFFNRQFKKFRVDEASGVIAQWTKVLTGKPDNLSSIFWEQNARNIQLPKVTSYILHVPTYAHTRGLGGG